MGVGFAFEADGAVGMHGVAFDDEADEPFDEVPEVEAEDERLQHLCRVDAFVVEVNSREPHVLACEDDAEEVDG